MKNTTTKLSFVFSFLFSLALCSFCHADGPLKIALILDKGGKDDKSFNSAAYKGATEARDKLGIFLKDIEATDDSMFEQALKSFASKKFDLIISVGVNQAEALNKVASQYPNQKFAIIDARVNLPNVYSALFAEQEGSFLVGYIAAMKANQPTIGFIGGMEIPLIKRFEKAYVQGVKSALPNAKTLVNYVGATSDAWNNPTKAKEIALSQFKQGASVIFCPAGASNNGCFDAAEELKHFSIGVDSNQNWIKPGRVLTSMLKRVDVAVYEVIESTQKNQFKPGLHEFNLKNKGVDWALDNYNKSLFTAADLKKIEGIKSQIISGQIKVQDYYKKP